MKTYKDCKPFPSICGSSEKRKSDPIVQIKGKWYFWNEVWTDKYGPYENKEEANKKLLEYSRVVLGP